MSPLTRMAAERAEHEQVQVQARARMPLLPPPVLRGFGGRLGHCVLYSVDVLLAHRGLHGVDVLFGHRALRVLAGAATAAFRRCGR